MDEEVMDLVQPEKEVAGVSAADGAVLEGAGTAAPEGEAEKKDARDLSGDGKTGEAQGEENGSAAAADAESWAAVPDTVRKDSGTEAQAGTRDYRAEAAELLERFPQARQGTLPEEVVRDAVERGMSLAAAYEAYEARSLRAELESLRKENAVLKQAAESAARAPVRAVSAGGGTDTEPDDFLKGFEGEN